MYQSKELERLGESESGEGGSIGEKEGCVPERARVA